MPRVSRWVFAAVATVSVILAAPAAAYACDPYTTDPSNRYSEAANWLGGEAQDTSNNWSWVQANIEVREPTIHHDSGQTNATNFTYAWNMLNGCATNNCWAQIGPATLNDGSRVDFVQCWNGNIANDYTDIYLPAEPVNSTPLYETANGGIGKTFSIDGSQVMACAWTFTPTRAEAASEIHNRRDQVYGTTSNHEGFTNAQAEGTGGTIHDLFQASAFDITFYGGTNPSWFHQNDTDTQHLETWDGDCS